MSFHTQALTSTLLLSLLTLFLLSIASAAPTSAFIRSKCSTTAYPAACVDSLSSFSDKIQKSPRQLASTALTLSLAKARYTKSCISKMVQTQGLKPREACALKDCMEEISDTVDRLGKSVHEFQMAVRARSHDLKWHMSNVLTWASAALTDENTCLDGFDGMNGRMKNAIKAQFEGVVQSTSNALALVNQFANKYCP